MDKSKSLIIVALALLGSHDGVHAQTSPFVSNSNITQHVPNSMLVASGGNPWALPDPENEYGYQDSRPTPPRPERPRYISPEELKSLDKLPPERRELGSSWMPRNNNDLTGSGSYGGTYPVNPDYYRQDYFPSGSYYGSPYGTGPLYDPYGGSYMLPYGGILPFLY